jgi:glycosyltransferase involved in cell wall biosynthesis
MNGFKKPWVSFCMSTYKRPDYLKNTLASILNQSFSNLEVVISDNDIENSASKIVSEINDPRVRYYSNGTNLGMIKSFTNSLNLASGEYIVMITDDDPVYPDMLETLYNLQNKYPGYGMYMGGCDWVCKSAEIGALYKLHVGTNSCLSNNFDLGYVTTFEPATFLKDFFSLGLFTHYLWSTCLVSRDVLLKNGGIPDYGTPFLGDYAYIALMGGDSGCVLINKALGCQTIHKGNFGRNQNEQLPIVAKEFPAYLKKYLSGVKDWPIIEKLILKFTGLWLIGHMAFLYHYSSKGDATFNKSEKEVLKLAYVKKYRFKYILKKKFPKVHTLLVKIKGSFTKKK